MAERDATEQTVVCQRPFVKRRRKSKSHNIEQNSIVEKNNFVKCTTDDSLHAVSPINEKWIDNSFGSNKTSNVCHKNDAAIDTHDADALNNSDLLLAQIDIEELSKSSKTDSGQENKDSTSTTISDEKIRSSVESSCQDVPEVCPWGERDLFEEDDIDTVFSPKYAALQPNICYRENAHSIECNRESVHTLGSKVMKEVGTKSCKGDIQKGEYNVSGPKEEEGTSACVQFDHQITKTKDLNNLSVGNSISSPCIGGQSIQGNSKASLKDRMKAKLLMNGSVTSGNHSDENKRREEALALARMEASQIRKEGTAVDIGPFYGLPSKVEELFKSLRGIQKLYDWQVECLSLPAVKQRKNLIYTLPTSGGKTLVAEILILRELLCHQKDAMLVLPFVSIVQEKVRTISEFATELGFLVEEYAGSKGRLPPIKRRKKHSLYIATIEKSHSLINSLIETERIDTLGLVVVDELHMLGEGGSRGANLENMLLKLLHSKAVVQIIGMSATLNNLEDLQTFLKAELYSNDFRPVSLEEYVKVEDDVYKVEKGCLDSADLLQHSRVALFPYTSECLKRDPDHLLGLVTETIPGNSCLVFCSTKKNCENVAQLLSELICKYYRHLSQVKRDKRKILLRELQQDGDGKICPILKYTVHFGIAYHHSGLTMDERRLIEDAYLEGTLCLLTCTTTLAAGVNLPARRVILRSPYVGTEFIKYSQYKQMTGRAGRAGMDTMGESFLIANRKDKLKIKDLLAGPNDCCYTSLMYDGGKGIQSLLLSAIGLKLIPSTDSAFHFLESSLLRIQAKNVAVDVSAVTKNALQFLIDNKLVVQVVTRVNGQENQLNLQVTDLGRATFKGSVDHAYSSQLYKDLKTAEQSLVLSNHFHLLYLVTPYDTALSVSPSWDIYYNQFCNLSEAELQVARLVGIPESYLNRKAVGLSSKQKVDTLAMNRFFLTLMLWKLWNQNSIWDVAYQFSIPRGFVQNLLAQSSAFASCVYHFCQELEEFWAFQELMANFVKRLSYCVTSELIPLMEVPGVKLARAKQLYSAGLNNLASLASVDPSELATKIEHLSKRQAQQIISSAKNLVEEKTAALLEEVETLVSVPIADL